MKKRFLVLALAVMMMLAVAAPALAAGDDDLVWDSLYLGQTLTAEELLELVEAEALTVFHVKHNGARLEGVYLGLYGEVSAVRNVTPNELVFVDADEVCSLVRVVQQANGDFVLQVHAQGYINANSLTPLEVLLSVTGSGILVW